MTIFNAASIKQNEQQNQTSTLRAILSSSLSYSNTQPIKIKNDTNSGGHHHIPNHMQTHYLDASCLTKAKLNETLNKSSNNSNTSSRIPFKTYKHLDWSWNYTMEPSCNVDSPPLLLSNDAKSVCFHPYCMGCFETNGIQGHKPLKLNAFTYWEVSLAEGVCAGSSVMIGIGRKNSKLNANGYINLIGADANSWGLSNKGALWHANQTKVYCLPFDDQKLMRIGCLFDGYNGRLSFFRNGVYMGVAFENLITRNANGLCDVNHELFPMVSSTVSKSLIRLEVACENFATLKEMCRERVQQQMILGSNSSSINVGDESKENFYESFIHKRSSLATSLPRTVVDYLSNK